MLFWPLRRAITAKEQNFSYLQLHVNRFSFLPAGKLFITDFYMNFRSLKPRVKKICWPSRLYELKINLKKSITEIPNLTEFQITFFYMNLK